MKRWKRTTALPWRLYIVLKIPSHLSNGKLGTFDNLPGRGEGDLAAQGYPPVLNCSDGCETTTTTKIDPRLREPFNWILPQKKSSDVL